ncbi:hypothetical protein MEO41_28655, partial [Dolichospermum sp. ST_sed4]|nr:hypothetical protein [Dolichospermum sp. ST_sed4]
SCDPDAAYVYALDYPMVYSNYEDTLWVVGNGSMGNSSEQSISFYQIYEFARATKGSCIMQNPATGTYIVLSRMVIGNGTNEVFVESKGESISFSSVAMPQLLVNRSASLTFGGIE